MDLESIMLSDTSQSEKAKYHIFHFMVITNGKVGVGKVEVSKGGINADRRWLDFDCRKYQ